jgi:hypothetical protein
MQQLKPAANNNYDYNVLGTFSSEAKRCVVKFLTVGEFNSMWCAFSRRPLNSEWRSWDGLTTRTGFFRDKWAVRLLMIERVFEYRTFNPNVFPSDCVAVLRKHLIGDGGMALLRKFLLGWKDSALTLITFPLKGVKTEVGIITCSSHNSYVSRVPSAYAEEMRKNSLIASRSTYLLNDVHDMRMSGQKFGDMNRHVYQYPKIRFMTYADLEDLYPHGNHDGGLGTNARVFNGFHPDEPTPADGAYTDFLDQLVWTIKESKDFESNRQRAIELKREDDEIKFYDELNCCLVQSRVPARLALDKSEYDSDGEEQSIFRTERSLFAHVPVRGASEVLADQLAFLRKLKRAPVVVVAVAVTTAAAAQ